MARLGGFEPTTSASAGLRSIQLSYKRVFFKCRSGEMVDALRSGRSVCNGHVGSNPSFGTLKYALVAQLDRAQPCEG